MLIFFPDLDPTASSSSHPEILTVGIDEYEQQLKFPGEKPDWAPNFIKLVQHTIPTPDETIVNIPDNLLIKQIPSVVSKGISFLSGLLLNNMFSPLYSYYLQQKHLPNKQSLQTTHFKALLWF